jgi:hypothetical protein
LRVRDIIASHTDRNRKTGLEPQFDTLIRPPYGVVILQQPSQVMYQDRSGLGSFARCIISSCLADIGAEPWLQLHGNNLLPFLSSGRSRFKMCSDERLRRSAMADMSERSGSEAILEPSLLKLFLHSIGLKQWRTHTLITGKRFHLGYRSSIYTCR